MGAKVKFNPYPQCHWMILQMYSTLVVSRFCPKYSFVIRARITNATHFTQLTYLCYKRWITIVKLPVSSHITRWVSQHPWLGTWVTNVTLNIWNSPYKCEVNFKCPMNLFWNSPYKGEVNFNEANKARLYWSIGLTVHNFHSLILTVSHWLSAWISNPPTVQWQHYVLSVNFKPYHWELNKLTHPNRLKCLILITLFK